MPIRIFDPLERPSAADLNRYFMQQEVIVKPSATSRNSTITLTDDPHLLVPVLASTDYWIWCLLFYTGPSTNGDVKLKWTGPSGATMNWISDGMGSAATATPSIVSRNLQSISGTPQVGTLGTDTAALIKGLLRVSTTAGNLQLQWAQGTSSATDCTIYEDSTIIARRLTL